MFNNCTGLYENTIEEINELIDRFYKKAGRSAEASGAESMLPYITQRDERISQLENSSSSHYSEMERLRKEKDATKLDSESLRRKYYAEKDENEKFHALSDERRLLLIELSKVKEYGRLVPKKLRDKIKSHL